MYYGLLPEIKLSYLILTSILNKWELYIINFLCSPLTLIQLIHNYKLLGSLYINLGVPHVPAD